MKYSYCVCVCVYVAVWLSSCLSVCLAVRPSIHPSVYDNFKNNQLNNRNMRFEYVFVYENILDKFDIGHCWLRIRGHQTFSPFSAIQTVRSCNSILVQARMLLLSMYDHLIII